MAKKTVKQNENKKELSKVELAMAEIAGHYGSNIVFSGSSDSFSRPRFETKLPTLNKIISNKYSGKDSGLPLGCIYNLFGMESTGKSALAQLIAGEFLKQSKSVLWIDNEGTFDFDYSSKYYGIKENDPLFTLGLPFSAEQSLDTIVAFVNNEAKDLIVLDSIAGLESQSVIDKYSDQNSMAELPRRLSAFFPKIMQKIYISNITIIFINQLRANINQMGTFGNKYTGGNAMKFFPHIALRLKDVSGGEIKRRDEVVGKRVELHTTKNKTSKPKMTGHLTFFDGEGFSRVADIIELSGKVGVLSAKGSWYTYKDKSIAQGIDKLRTVLLEDEKLLDNIWSETIKILEPKG